jgi:hypothetical protein
MNTLAALLGTPARAISLAAAAFSMFLAMAGCDTAAAIDFTCVEPSRYKSLMQAFNDNPESFVDYFGLDRSRLPDMGACRALTLTGTIGPRDAERLLDQVIQNKGWLAVLYLSFDGVNLGEEIKIAQLVRSLSLKTRVLLGPSFRYQPDFASQWDAPPLMGVNAATTESFEVSSINKGMEAFGRRGDLDLRLAFDGSICAGSCVGAWSAGVNRLISPLPLATSKAFSEPVPEIVWAPAQAALLSSLDGVKAVSATSPVVAPATSHAALPVAPPAMQRVLRDKCGAYLATTDAVVDRVVRAIKDAGSSGFHDISVEQYQVGSAMIKSLISDFDTLDQAGARQQRCLAQTYEAERLASFDRSCSGGCDKAKLVQAFERSARTFVEADLTFAKLFGNAGGGDIGQQWDVDESGWHGTFARRGTTNVFDAVWVKDRDQAKATIEIGRTGDRIFAIRTQPEGRCLYQGTVNSRAISGTYVCTFAQGAFGWTAAISTAPPPAASPAIPDIAGVWRCNDGGTYTIQQSGSQITWEGVSADGGKAWANSFSGMLAADVAAGAFTDHPPGAARGHGDLSIKIVAPDRIEKISGTGFGGSVWTRVGAPGNRPPL